MIRSLIFYWFNFSLVTNLSKTQSRSVIIQAGAYGEHQFKIVTLGNETTNINASMITVELAPGAGQTLSILMDLYTNTPTILHPWQH